MSVVIICILSSKYVKCRSHARLLYKPVPLL